MNKIILGLLLLFVSLERTLAYDIKIQTLPEEYFFFRPVGERINAPGNEKNPATTKTPQATMKAASDEMSAEVKKYKLTPGGSRLTVLNYKINQIVMTGIPVSGPNLAAVPKEKLRLRPAGKYLMLTYVGANRETQNAFQAVRSYVLNNKIKTIGNNRYVYFKTPNEPRIYLIPIE